MPAQAGEALLHNAHKGDKKPGLIAQVAPIVEWLPQYDIQENLFADISCALTLGCILIGQSLAHAKLCGVALIRGPYSCMIGPALYSVFGTCIHSSIGTGALICLLVGDVLMKAGDTLEERTYLVPILTLEVGLILALMGICRLSSLVRFLSRPALSGFITGSSMLACLSQVTPMLGLPDDVGSIQHVLRHHPAVLEGSKPPTAILSVVAVFYLMNAKHLKKVEAKAESSFLMKCACKVIKIFGDFKELCLLGIGSIFCICWNPSGISPSECQEDSNCIKIVGHIPVGLPSLVAPPVASEWDTAVNMIPGACLVALVAFLTSFAGAKKFALQDGYQISPFNELLAIGMCNVGGAFMGAVPTSIGNTRMGIARNCGVKSQLGANVFVAIFVAGAVRFLTEYLYNIPMCSLNAIIIIGSSHMLEFSHAGELYNYSKLDTLNWKTRMDIIVWLAGFFSTLFQGALSGILIACGLSLFIIVFQVVNPDMVVLGHKRDRVATRTDRKWVSLPRPDADEEAGILVFRFEGPLFYANVEQLHEWLEVEETKRLESTDGFILQAIIFSCTGVPWMDTTAINALKLMIEAYTKRDIIFLVANTYGNTGRAVSKFLEDVEKKAIPSESLQDKLHDCSTIDDFVELARQSMQARQKEKGASSVSSLRSMSGMLRARSRAKV